MDTNERRNEILSMLQRASQPLSASHIASRFHVSRQIVVGDVALLRARGHQISSTPRGYLLQDTAENDSAFPFLGMIACCHNTSQLAEELYTIVDLGGTAEDVSVRHRVYGRLRADLKVSSRLDVHRFLKELKSGKSTPLKDITSGYHYHTILADSEETLDLIQRELRKKGYLCEQ